MWVPRIARRRVLLYEPFSDFNAQVEKKEKALKWCKNGSYSAKGYTKKRKIYAWKRRSKIASDFLFLEMKSQSSMQRGSCPSMYEIKNLSSVSVILMRWFVCAAATGGRDVNPNTDAANVRQSGREDFSLSFPFRQRGDDAKYFFCQREYLLPPNQALLLLRQD